MSKVPKRPLCASCNKCSHGISNCKGGKCTCKCREMSQSELDDLQKKYHDEIPYEYSEESQQQFESIMSQYNKLKSLVKNNIKVKTK